MEHCIQSQVRFYVNRSVSNCLPLRTQIVVISLFTVALSSIVMDVKYIGHTQLLVTDLRKYVFVDLTYCIACNNILQ